MWASSALAVRDRGTLIKIDWTRALRHLLESRSLYLRDTCGGTIVAYMTHECS